MVDRRCMVEIVRAFELHNAYMNALKNVAVTAFEGF